jgi:hypothetical protein
VSTAFTLVRRLGLTRKKLHMIARARCEEERADYIDYLLEQGFTLEELVFMDESATNTSLSRPETLLIEATWTNR